MRGQCLRISRKPVLYQSIRERVKGLSEGVSERIIEELTFLVYLGK